MKKLYVVGNPIAHSLSPLMHNKALQELQLDNKFVYDSMQLQEQELGKFFDDMRQGFIQGVNITLPYKEKCINNLDKLDKIALDIGAVNTVVFCNNALIGYNTDSMGFIRSLQEKKIYLPDKNVLILGAGGSAGAISYGLLQEKANVLIKNRTFDPAVTLVKKFQDQGNIAIYSDQVQNQIDIVVNCTSVGLDGVSIPFDYKLSENVELVIDIIYNPFTTPLLKKASGQGIDVLNGVDMLVNQGFESFKLFTNHTPNKDIMKKEILRYFGRSSEK